jgi:hypothetical protein
MRNLILVGAAALVLASAAAPASAGGFGFFPMNLCESKESGKVIQCASNNFKHANNSGQVINQDQTLNSKKSKLSGLLEFQSALNLKFKGTGGEQGITQHQTLDLYKSEADAELGYGKYKKISPIVVNEGTNLVIKGDNDRQYIDQSQTITAKHTELEGTQAYQNAFNFVGEGNGNFQAINQTQTINIDDSSYHHGDSGGCGGYGKCGPGPS